MNIGENAFRVQSPRGIIWYDRKRNPAFGQYDVIVCTSGGRFDVEESINALQLVFYIGRARLGRRRLAVRTGLSEMTVRLELERLREFGFVNLGRSGAELTEAGRERFASLFERVRAVRAMELTSLQLDEVALAAQLRAEERSPAWAYRDQAVREGATGLVLLRFNPQGWCFAHNDEPIATQNPRDASSVNGAFPDCRVGDRLIIAFGSDRRQAGLGLWRVIKGIAWDS